MLNFQDATKPYNNAIGRAFEKRNIPLLRLLKSKTVFQAGLGGNQKRFIYDDINSATAKTICNNKNYTKYLLDLLDLPIPHGIKIYSEEDIEKGFAQLEKPLVVKPVSEMWGKGVTTGIETLEEAREAYAVAKEFNGRYVIMEEHVEGADHRILILGGKFIAGLKRSAPFVTGDGQSTVAELIRKENEKRKHSSKIVKKILVDRTVENFLAKSNLSLDSVPPIGEKIPVRMTGNICSEE